MALKGDLTDISIADLIQLHCQSGVQARLYAWRQGEELVVYFAEGEVVHAQLGEIVGEEAVYHLLRWPDGSFAVEQGAAAPQRSIHLPWSALVMEGLRQVDERGMLVDAPPPAVEDPLGAALRRLSERSSFVGLVLLRRDGALLAAELPATLDRARVGAVAAGILNLSARSVGQLDCGVLQQTLVQGSIGSVVLTPVGAEAILVALADPAVNLGMTFFEARQGVETLEQVLSEAKG